MSKLWLAQPSGLTAGLLRDPRPGKDAIALLNAEAFASIPPALLTLTATVATGAVLARGITATRAAVAATVASALRSLSVARMATAATVATRLRSASVVRMASVSQAAAMARGARVVRSVTQATVATLLRIKVKVLTLFAAQSVAASMAATSGELRLLVLSATVSAVASIRRSPRAVKMASQSTQATIKRMVSMLRILTNTVLTTLQRTAGVVQRTTQALEAQMGEPMIPTAELELISLLRALPALSYLRGVFLNAADEGTKLPYVVITATHAPDLTISGAVDADHITFTITAWGASALVVEGIIDLVVELLQVDGDYDVIERTAGFDEATGDDAAVLIVDRWITT